MTVASSLGRADVVGLKGSQSRSSPDGPRPSRRPQSAGPLSVPSAGPAATAPASSKRPWEEFREAAGLLVEQPEMTEDELDRMQRRLDDLNRELSKVASERGA